MSETVVARDPNSVVTSGDDSKIVVTEGRYDYDHYSTAERVKDVLGPGQTALVEDIKEAEASLIEDIKEVDRTVESAKAKILDTVREVGSDNLAATKDAEVKNVEVVKDAERVNLAATKDAEIKLEELIEENKVKTVELIKDNELSMEKSGDFTRRLASEGFKEQLFRTTKDTNQIVDNIKIARQDILLEEKETQKLTQRLFLEAERTVNKQHSDVMLAFKDEAIRLEQLSKESGLQHYELKELIRMDGQKTRDLIQQKEEQNLRDKLAEKDRMLAAYFAKGVSPTMP